MCAAVKRLPAHVGCGFVRNADCEQNFAIGRALPHGVVAVVGAVQMILSVDVEPVSTRKQSFTPAVDEMAVTVQDYHRMGAPIENIDPIPTVDSDGGDVLEVPTLRQLFPILNHAIAMLAQT